VIIPSRPTPADPTWSSLPGYPDTGIPDLVGLHMPIEWK